MLGGLGPGQILIADRTYDSDLPAQKDDDWGAWANVKPMPGRVKKQHRGERN